MRARAMLRMLAAAGALAGCAATPFEPSSLLVIEPSETPVGPRGEGEVWVVWVHGSETTVQRGLVRIRICDLVYDRDFDLAGKTLNVSESRYPDVRDDVTVILVWDHFEDGHCPIAWRVDFSDRASADLGPPGVLAVEVLEDGTLALNGETYVLLGQRARIAYTGEREGQRVEGEVRVENLGAWPRSNLRRVPY